MRIFRDGLTPEERHLSQQKNTEQRRIAQDELTPYQQEDILQADAEQHLVAYS